MADSSRPWTPPPSGLVDALGSTESRVAIADRLSPTLPLVARRALSLVAVAAVASWLGYYVITPLPSIVVETFRATVMLHAVTGAVLIPYLLYLLVARRLPGGSILDLPLVALLGLYLLATAASDYWRVSLEVTLVALMGLGVFYVLSDSRLLRRWQLESALMLALLAAAVKALWLVGGVYVDWLRLAHAVDGNISWSNAFPPTVPKIPTSISDHPNLLGGMFAMGLPFFLVAMLRPWPKVLRALVALASIAVLLALFLSLARSAWLAGVAGVATTALLLFAYAPAGRAFVRRVRPSTPGRQALAGLTALALAGVALGIGWVVQSVQARPIWLFRESGSPRVDVMGAGADMFRDHLLSGTGPGVYRLLYPQYSGAYPLHAFHSHNGFLQTAVDLGVPGAIAMVVLVGALGWLLIRPLRAADSETRLSLAACAGAFVALAVFSVFDSPNAYKGPLAVIAAVGAIAVVSSRDAEPGAMAGGRFSVAQAVQFVARVSVPVALAGLLIVWGRLDFAHYYYSNGVGNADAQHWSVATSDLERAVELDPEYAAYRLELGVVRGQAYLQTRDPAMFSGAVAELQLAANLDPRGALAHVNQALLYASANDHAKTASEALLALRYASSDAAIALAAGTAFEQQDWPDQAVVAYAAAVFFENNLAESPFWTATPLRQQRFWDIIGRSSLVNTPCRLLHLIDSDAPPGPVTRQDALAHCGQAVQVNPDELEGRVWLANAFITDEQYADARTLLDRVLGRQPDNGPARTAFGRLYAAQGNVDQAREQWLRAGYLGDTDALVLLGDSYPAGHVPPNVVETLRSNLGKAETSVQFDLSSLLYYRLKFFRASPTTMIVPGEWQDAVPARSARARDALSRWTNP